MSEERKRAEVYYVWGK